MLKSSTCPYWGCRFMCCQLLSVCLVLGWLVSVIFIVLCVIHFMYCSNGWGSVIHSCVHSHSCAFICLYVVLDFFCWCWIFVSFSLSLSVPSLFSSNLFWNIFGWNFYSCASSVASLLIKICVAVLSLPCCSVLLFLPCVCVLWLCSYWSLFYFLILV